MREKNINPTSDDDISPIRLGNIYDEKFGTGYAGNVWDKEGISPTLQTAQGGNRQPLVFEESKVVKVGQASSDGSQCGTIYSTDDLAPTLTAGCHGYAMGYIAEEQEPFIVASRGRNPENPSDRTAGTPTEQRLEPNFSGCTNTLTSVQKDNYVCEPQVLRAERTDYGKSIRKQYEAGEIDEKISNMRELKPRTDGVSNTITTLLKDNYVAEPQLEFVGSIGDKDWAGDGKELSRNYPQGSRVYSADGIAASLTAQGVGGAGGMSGLYAVEEPIVYDDYNSRISSDQDAINTLTCNCGASAERNGVKIIEPRIIEDQFPGSRDARIYTEYSPTLRQNCNGLKVANGDDEVVEVPKIRWRIRKLTSKECFRLMGFTDKDHDRAAQYVSDSSRYKQAGNSIVVDCLISIFSSLFIKDGYKEEVWTKYFLDYNAE